MFWPKSRMVFPVGVMRFFAEKCSFSTTGTLLEAVGMML